MQIQVWKEYTESYGNNNGDVFDYGSFSPKQINHANGIY